MKRNKIITIKAITDNREALKKIREYDHGEKAPRVHPKSVKIQVNPDATDLPALFFQIEKMAIDHNTNITLEIWQNRKRKPIIKTNYPDKLPDFT